MNDGVSAPLNIAQLERRLAGAAHDFGIPISRARVLLCALIVSQMLPEQVTVKGGMGVKLRLGESGTRTTSDLDVSAGTRGRTLENSIRDGLSSGWGRVSASRGQLKRDPISVDRTAFTADLKRLPEHDPGVAAPQYLVHPYRVTLWFLGVQWGSADLEISDPEIEPYWSDSFVIDDELHEFAAKFGFGILRPVRLVKLEYQLAQKIHAVTDPDYTRAYDLVDLQILWQLSPEVSELRNSCLRTFAFRAKQSWPPVPLRSMENWERAYMDARDETLKLGESPAVQTLAEARMWLENVIAMIDAAPGPTTESI